MTHTRPGVSLVVTYERRTGRIFTRNEGHSDDPACAALHRPTHRPTDHLHPIRQLPRNHQRWGILARGTRQQIQQAYLATMDRSQWVDGGHQNMSDRRRPPTISMNAFSRAKAEYAAALRGMCETCTQIVTRVNVTYMPPPGAADFDPEYFLCRCQSCLRRGRTELIKIRLVDAYVA